MNRQSRVRGRVSVGVVALSLMAALGASAIARPAAACGDEWFPYMDMDYRPAAIDRAEKALDQGKLVAAAGIVIRVMPHITQLTPGKFELTSRATRVLAVATTRFNGALPVGAEVPDYAQGSWLGKTAVDRSKNLEWAISSLRALNAKTPDDTALESDLAEALSKVDAHRAEARTILERLAAKDLVATPDAYAALAALRREAGDTQGQGAAVARCEAMAKSATVCHAG